MSPQEAYDTTYNNFLQGYNCTQSVVLTFSSFLKLNQESTLKAAQGFGGGLCRLRQTCGAVSGMIMVLGLIEGSCDPKDKNAKDALYRHGQLLIEEFSRQTGSYICSELLGLDKNKVKENHPSESEERTAGYYKKRPCPVMCATAAKILAEYLGW